MLPASASSIEVARRCWWGTSLVCCLLVIVVLSSIAPTTTPSVVMVAGFATSRTAATATVSSRRPAQEQSITTTRPAGSSSSSTLPPPPPLLRLYSYYDTTSTNNNNHHHHHQPLPQRHFTQVISDVDDTIKSSGGINVAGVTLGGIDVQYDRGELYPGVCEFMLQISLGCGNGGRIGRGGDREGHRQDNNGEKENKERSLLGGRPRIVTATSSRAGAGQRRRPSPRPPPPKVAILTARAEEFKLALRLKEDSPIAQSFRRVGEAVGIHNWGLGPVLYGSVAEWIVQKHKGLRKFTNFERLLQQDPTGNLMQYIYVGDVGELDQEAGETMLREYPELVKAVFLHVVSDQRCISTSDLQIPSPKLINGRPVIFFRTYVGAAVAAVNLGFMSLEGLERVMEAAAQQLDAVPRSSDKWCDLQVDLEQASELILPSPIMMR